MNITYIFGNGFDCQIGLRTRYSDFLEHYIKNRETDDDNISAFKDYLDSNRSDIFWSDAELGMGEHLGAFSDITLASYTDRKADFEEKLIEYLTAQQEKCIYEDKESIKVIFEDFIYNSYGDSMLRRGNDLGIPGNSNNLFQFITFNYTNVLDRILKCCVGSDGRTLKTQSTRSSSFSDTVSQVYHVHGNLSDGIISGVNDENQMNVSGGVKIDEAIRWTLIKPYLNQASGYNWDQPAKDAILRSSIIYIYGTSFGDTDRLWWNCIREWLLADTNHKIVWFVHDDKELSTKILWKEIDYDDNQRRILLDNLGCDFEGTQYNQMLTQTYIIRNTQRLDLKKVLMKEAPSVDVVGDFIDRSTRVAIFG